MMRSLWTGASGMTAQQLNIDVISNNISNVNTTGYKRERAEFQTLLYQTLGKPTQAGENSTLTTPAPMQVGHGVRSAAISRDYQGGSMQNTENTFDFALNGTGFFTIQKDDGIAYTRDGSFKTSVDTEDEELHLVTTDGYPVLDTNGEPIIFGAAYEITVDQMGNFFAVTQEGNETLDIQMQLTQFTNPNGLETIGQNLYKETIASGAPINESEGEVQNRTSVHQGFTEMSNVAVADEMVKLIVAQRAYELNSKSITTSDEMLQTANNLKR